MFTWRLILRLSGFVCLLALAAGFFPASSSGADQPDLVMADFEDQDYGVWKAEGQAFGPGPAQGTLAGQMQVSGFQGKGLVNTFFQGDRTTGRLTSPVFQIERPYINFLIGGGAHPGETCVNLLVDGETVRTATGPNDRPGGTERLDWHSWDVEEFAGQEATLVIVDQATGGWGHINIDHIVQSNKKRQAEPAVRQFVIQQRYLHLPVKNGAAKQRMRFEVDGETVREFTIELASPDVEPDFWVFADVSDFQGKTLVARADRLASGAEGLAAIKAADEVPNAEGMYREKYRPQFHFSSRRGWNNDPNGLVYHHGEYHLYYQHNPYGWKWGNMHWGHAVSPDLVHWTELPIAIYPFKFGDWVFSGSAVIDRHNTGGFKTGDEDVIIAAYTSTGRGEAIAFSNDRGRTFTDYQGNPVVKHGGRDPKLIWYARGEHWVMAVYDERDGSRGMAFYTSNDLREWTYQSRIDGYYECPEIFELPLDGDKDNTRWVVYAADGAYALGHFDGKTFTTESGKHRFNWGNCFYASQTYSDIPADDGRRIQIAWGRSGHGDMPFNQMMNFPVALTLRETDQGVRMFAQPVGEIESLHEKGLVIEDKTLEANDNPLADLSGDLFHIRAEFELDGANEFGLNVRGVPITYNVAEKKIVCSGKEAPIAPVDGRIWLEVLVDRTTIEIFVNTGHVYMPIAVIPEDENRSLGVFTTGGTTRIRSLEVFPLKSAWRE